MNKLIVVSVFVLSLATHAAAQGAGGVASAEPAFRVLRSVSGSNGSEQNGRYVMADPRSIFYFPADKRVIVYFEWEGPLGPHHFEGFWKSPEGKVVVISDFSYEARQKRFGGYWSLDLSDAIKPGMWALEARVDGEVTGTHTFQIVSAEKPASAPAGPPLLTPSEIYTRAVSASVWVENLNEKKERITTGSGFFIGDGLVVTAFQVMDGAASLRLKLPDGRTVETTTVAALNRLQDWAVLKVPATGAAKLEAAKPKSWSVGDRCFSLDVPTEGNRVIVDENITGANSFTDTGDRFNVSSPPAGPAIGSPVLNEYGQLLGVLGGSTFPGARRSDSGAYAVAALRAGGLVTPIELVALHPAEASSRTLDQLRTAGLFVTPLAKESEFLYGLLGTHFEVKKGQLPTSREVRSEFSRADKQCEVMVVFNPRVKIKGELTMMVYDINNRPVVRTDPTKVKANPGQYFISQWEFELGQLKASRYRVDVLQDKIPIWRAFFRVTD